MYYETSLRSYCVVFSLVLKVMILSLAPVLAVEEVNKNPNVL